MNKLMLQEDPDVVEDNVIHALFPYATTDPDTLPDLQGLIAPTPLENFDYLFPMGELLADLGQGKARSAPGYDNITWQLSLPRKRSSPLLTTRGNTGHSG